MNPFIVYDDERLTFAEAHGCASEIARLLTVRYGVAKGNRIAISMRNYPEWICAFMAATSLGAIAVAMNALWQPGEMAFAPADCGAKVLFADQERLDRLARCADRPTVDVIAVRSGRSQAGAPDLAALLDGVRDAAMPSADVRPEDPATIFYTSGSAGAPRA